MGWIMEGGRASWGMHDQAGAQSSDLRKSLMKCVSRDRQGECSGNRSYEPQGCMSLRTDSRPAGAPRHSISRAPDPEGLGRSRLHLIQADWSLHRNDHCDSICFKAGCEGGFNMHTWLTKYSWNSHQGIHGHFFTENKSLEVSDSCADHQDSPSSQTTQGLLLGTSWHNVGKWRIYPDLAKGMLQGNFP